MNYSKYNYKKEMIRNVLMMGLILFIAIFFTYNIYYKFNDKNNVDFSSASLDINFHEENGEELDITKITPVTDSVGLSSPGHTITITNNLTEPVDYKIKLVDNEKKLQELDSEMKPIPKDEIRVSIKKSGVQTEVYTLTELEDNVLLETTASPLEETRYTIRIWVTNESSLPIGSSNYYHGLIQIEENNKTAKK